MKKITFKIVLVILSIITTFPLVAQIRGNGEITKQNHNIGSFDAIKVDGARTVYLTQGDSFSVEVETDSNIQEYVTVEVKGSTLNFGFNTNKIKKYKVLNFYVTAPDIKQIRVSGASDMISKGTLSGDDLKIIVSGASDIILDVDYKSIITKVSGASDVTLTGVTVSSVVESSGASDFHGKNLVSTSSVVNASGASSCFVNAKSNLSYQVSGASEVRYASVPETVIIKNSNEAKEIIVLNDTTLISSHYTNYDTTKVNVGLLNVEVIEGDTTFVSVGRHTLIVSDDGDVKWERRKVRKFNGHWGGFELGINGYVTPDFNTNWAAEYDYLNLRYEKSIAVNLNIYEQNIALNKNKTIGLVTGLGLSWNNYRFSNNTYLSPDSTYIKGYYMEDVSVRKTKLTAMYLTVPLIFEIQTNQPRNIHRFHFAFGVVANMRISTHTKVYFNDADKVYFLRDTGTDQILPTAYRTPNSNERNIVKNNNSFYLQPFKFDATVRFGYGIINLFATYSLNTMFQSDRGPELYPVTAGITIVGW
jgi:hypothetical protein